MELYLSTTLHLVFYALKRATGNSISISNDTYHFPNPIRFRACARTGCDVFASGRVAVRDAADLVPVPGSTTLAVIVLTFLLIFLSNDMSTVYYVHFFNGLAGPIFVGNLFLIDLSSQKYQ